MSCVLERGTVDAGHFSDARLGADDPEGSPRRWVLVAHVELKVERAVAPLGDPERDVWEVDADNLWLALEWRRGQLPSAGPRSFGRGEEALYWPRGCSSPSPRPQVNSPDKVSQVGSYDASIASEISELTHESLAI